MPVFAPGDTLVHQSIRAADSIRPHFRGNVLSFHAGRKLTSCANSPLAAVDVPTADFAEGRRLQRPFTALRKPAVGSAKLTLPEVIKATNPRTCLTLPGMLCTVLRARK